jgi:hypothetical protein
VNRGYLAERALESTTDLTGAWTLSYYRVYCARANIGGWARTRLESNMACIEATIPFRGHNGYGKSPAEVLEQRRVAIANACASMASTRRAGLRNYADTRLQKEPVG